MKTSLMRQNRNETDLEQGKITSIDRLKGRVSVSLRNGLTSAASYLYDVANLREGMSVLVGKVDGSYIIIDKAANVPRSGRSFSLPRPVIAPTPSDVHIEWDCTTLEGWNDFSEGMGTITAETFDGRPVWKFYTPKYNYPTPYIWGRSSLHKYDFFDPIFHPYSTLTYSMTLYFDSIGNWISGAGLVFGLGLGQGCWAGPYISMGSNGVSSFCQEGGLSTNLGDLIQEKTWQTWRIENSVQFDYPEGYRTFLFSLYLDDLLVMENIRGGYEQQPGTLFLDMNVGYVSENIVYVSNMTLDTHALGTEQTPPISPTNWTNQIFYLEQYSHVNNLGEPYLCVVSHVSSASTEPGVGLNWESVWHFMGGEVNE